MKQILLLFLLFILNSCVDETKFNKERWEKTEDGKYHPYRENMLYDLTNNHKLKGLTLKQIVAKIGNPDKKYTIDRKLYLIYTVIPNHKEKLLPIVLSQSLLLEIYKDSIVSFDICGLER